MALPSCIDTSGVAVITGGASGFGFEVAARLVKGGMRVAILDVSTAELSTAEEHLRSMTSANTVLAVHCNVTQMEMCRAANEAVATGFMGVPISLLFNNAGIAGGAQQGNIIEGDAAQWPSIFSVNVFGAVNILKAFLPGMIDSGPLASGKPSLVVTTSSVVGLLNTNPGPYSCSKMATTAVCEQLALELEDMGDRAKHISPHSLHPTVSATGFLSGRNADGVKQNEMGDGLKMLAKMGMSTAADIVDGFFAGLARGESYIIVDHPLDVSTSEQLRMRVDDQMSRTRPRKPKQLGMVLAMDPAGQQEVEERRLQLDKAGTARL